MPAKTRQAASVWATGAAEPAEPEQPALNRETIVREAVALLDTDGVEALSMRKLGTRLGTAATSLYRHVATKDQLLELAVDEVFGEITVTPAEDGDWRAAVCAASEYFRATVLRHPWLAAQLGHAGLAYLGPNLAKLIDAFAGLFAEAGFPDPSAALNTLTAYITGYGVSEAAWLTSVARSGETEAEFVARLAPAAKEAAAELQHTGWEGDDDVTFDDEGLVALRNAKFAYGLDVVLDGLALRR